MYPQIPSGLKLFIMASSSVFIHLEFKLEIPFLIPGLIGVSLCLLKNLRFLGLFLVCFSLVIFTSNITYSSIINVDFISLWIKNKLSDNLSSDKALGLMYDLSVADKALLPVEFKKLMYKSGIAHLIAVSGMHIGIVFFLMEFTLKKMSPLSLRRRHLIALLAVFFYGLITGFTIPVLRVLIMLTTFVVSKLVFESINAYEILFISASIIVLLMPDQILSWSFQLSYLGVLGIILGFNFYSFNSSYKWLNYLINSFLMGVYAQLFVSPLLIYYLGSYPTYSIFLSFLLTPVFILLISLIPLLLVEVSKVSVVVERLMEMIDKLCQLSLSLPYSQISIQGLSLFHLIVLYILIISGALFLKYRKLKYLKWTSVGLGVILVL